MKEIEKWIQKVKDEDYIPTQKDFKILFFLRYTYNLIKGVTE